MIAISILELHEHTELWVRKATEQEPIVVMDQGEVVAEIVAMPAKPLSPTLTRKMLPGFAELQAGLRGGTDSTEIISEMRDGQGSILTPAILRRSTSQSRTARTSSPLPKAASASAAS